MSDPERPDLEERTLAWLFGDDEDPGLIVDEAAARADYLPWLDRLERTLAASKAAVGAARGGVAEARMSALRAEILRRRAQPIDWAAARSDNLRSLAHASAFVHVEDRRRRRLATLGAVVALAAAVVFVVMALQRAEPEIDVATARALVADVAPEQGFGFGGAEAPSARDRGFLLGAVIDLSRPRSATGEPGASELELARKLAVRALAGLPAPDDAEARRARALGGCAAILIDGAERGACEAGLSEYLSRRDAFLSGH